MDMLKMDVQRIFDTHLLFNVGILYPAGEPISLHLLRCDLFAVKDHSFTARRLASAATSTRELSRSKSLFMRMNSETFSVFFGSQRLGVTVGA